MTVTGSYTLKGVVYISPGEIAEDNGLPKEPTENSQHKAEGLARFIEQYKRKPRLEALACSYLNQIQALETAIFEIINERSISAAVGSQLDVLGEVVGQERGGLSDDDYRVFIQARIQINKSDGHAKDMIDVLAATVDTSQGTPEIKFQDYYPAAFQISQRTNIGSRDPDFVFLLLSGAKPAGVRMSFIFSRSDADNQFRTKSSNTVADVAAQGLDSTVTPGGAGALASAK